MIFVPFAYSPNPRPDLKSFTHGLAGFISDAFWSGLVFTKFETGPKIITDETRQAMRECLANIQNGEYAKNFILENAAGAPSILSHRRLNANSKIEKVGAQLRAMMPWISENKLVDQSKN